MEAYDGAEALRIMETERPDLLLLDLHMPEIDGLGVLEHMAAREALADIPVIVISGQGQGYLNLPLTGAIELTREGGFHLGEVVQVLSALLTVLAPGWRQLDPRGPGPAEAPAGPPAS